MAGLVGYVHVEGPNGMTAFGPGDEVPEWAARKMGAHCFEDGEHPYPEDPEPVQPPADPPTPVGAPPKAGPGSTKDAWTAYAAALEVDITACGTRDEIVAAVAEAGHPVE